MVELQNRQTIPLGKAFEKQTKTIEEQGIKRIIAIEELQKKLLKCSSKKQSLTLLKHKQIFQKLANEN